MGKEEPLRGLLKEETTKGLQNIKSQHIAGKSS